MNMRTPKYLLLAVMLLTAKLIPAQESPGPPKPPNPEERLQQLMTRLQREVKLNNGQQETVKNAFRDFFAGMEKMRGNKQPPPPPPPPVNKTQRDSLATLRDAKIKRVLSAGQYKQYLEIEKAMRPPMRPPVPPKNK
jgi:hypothetical protein